MKRWIDGCVQWISAARSTALLLLLAFILLVLRVGQRLVEELLFNEAKHCG